MDTDATTTREVTARASNRRLGRAVSSHRDSLLRAGLNLVLVAMIAVPALLCILFMLDILGASYTGYDFSVYYSAGLMLRANPHANIFDLQLAQAAAQAHGAALPATAYSYPPLLAIMVTPMTLLPYRAAVDIWTILNLAVWILCAVLLAAWFRRALSFGIGSRDSGSDIADKAPVTALPVFWVRAPRLFTVALAVFLTLSYQPIEQSLVLGQVSLLILLLLMLVALLVERDHPYLAGGVLALAVWIKVFPALLIIYYLLRGRRRVVVGAVAGIVLLGLAQLPIVGVRGLLATRHLLDNGAFQATHFQNEALARVPLWIAAELGDHLTPALTVAGGALVAVISVVFLAALLRLRRQNPPQDTRQLMTDPAAANRDLLGYTWALCTMVLVSPLTWEHYDAWLLPAFIVCLGLAIHASVAGFRDARGGIRREVYVLAATIVAYVITMHHLPLGYDGTTTFNIGPYIGGHPLRPFFMLLRPLAALLIWTCSGALFLRAMASASGTGTPALSPVPSQPFRLPDAVQARVLAGLLSAACIMLAVLIAVTTAFGSYQPR